jgi:hypothetical protein
MDVVDDDIERVVDVIFCSLVVVVDTAAYSLRDCSNN